MVAAGSARDIRLRFEIDSPASAQEIEKLLASTERYCVVYQTLINAVPVEISR